MLPKHKEGLLVAMIKGKKPDDDEKGDDETSDEGYSVSDCARKMFAALQDDNEDDFVSAVEDLVSDLKKEDKKQDESDKDTSETEE